jgi:amidase
MPSSTDLVAASAADLQRRMSSGQLSSRDVVAACLLQVRRLDHDLHAMTALSPESRLLERAETLDQERAAGRLRGPLHGIPIILKVGHDELPSLADGQDIIDTPPDLEMPTTAGSWAMAESHPGRASPLVTKVPAILDPDRPLTSSFSRPVSSCSARPTSRYAPHARPD